MATFFILSQIVSLWQPLHLWALHSLGIGKRISIPFVMKLELAVVCGCYLVTFLDTKPLFDWWVVRRGSSNKLHKCTCLKDLTTYSHFLKYSALNIEHNGQRVRGRIYALSCRIIKHTLSTTISKAWDILSLVTLRRRFVNMQI